MESLNVSPLMTNSSTNEAGKYIFVPISKVDDVLDLLLNGGCEVYTIPVK